MTQPSSTFVAAKPTEADLQFAGVDEIRACWLHEGEAADLIRGLKYGRVTTAVTEIACAMTMVIPRASRISMITWVPCTPRRRRSRGFDPAELLARALARRLRQRVRPCLRRLDDQPQTCRTRQGRLVGPSLQMRSARRRVTGTVLIVDDVCTTGSTLRAATSVLRAAGATRVLAVVATLACQTAKPDPTKATNINATSSQSSINNATSSETSFLSVAGGGLSVRELTGSHATSNETSFLSVADGAFSVHELTGSNESSVNNAAPDGLASTIGQPR